MRITLLIGICMLLLPLLPALNIFFPVGTLLAERLLFIPSGRFSVLYVVVVSIAVVVVVVVVVIFTSILSHVV